MRLAVITLLFLLATGLVRAAEVADLQQKFNLKYREFLAQDSQSLLPLPQVDKAEWNRIQQTRTLLQLYSEPNRFYNGKSYTFTMYRDSESGSYYLDAKGGFWGMEQLVYGPFGDGELN